MFTLAMKPEGLSIITAHLSPYEPCPAKSALVEVKMPHYFFRRSSITLSHFPRRTANGTVRRHLTEAE